MTLRAEVRSATGNTQHFIGEVRNGEPVATKEVPVPRWVEIKVDESGIFLLHLDANGECIADTWHESIEQAKLQAEFEFGIKANDWVEQDT